MVFECIGLVTTVAGGDEMGHRDGRGADAQFCNPCEIWLDPLHPSHVYVHDTGNRAIRKLVPDGKHYHMFAPSVLILSCTLSLLLGCVRVWLSVQIRDWSLPSVSHQPCSTGHLVYFL